MRRAGTIGGVAVALVAVLLGGIWLGTRVVGGFGLLDLGRGEYTETGTTVVESVRELSELTTIEIVEATTIEQGTDRGILDVLRGDRIALLAVARVGAGVDLGQVTGEDVEVDLDARRIRLVVPAPTITYVALDNDATRVYDRDVGLFTKGDPQLESQARRTAEQLLRRRAIEAGILDDARRAARQRLGTFLRSLGFEEVEVVVAR